MPSTVLDRTNDLVVSVSGCMIIVSVTVASASSLDTLETIAFALPSAPAAQTLVTVNIEL